MNENKKRSLRISNETENLRIKKIKLLESIILIEFVIFVRV